MDAKSFKDRFNAFLVWKNNFGKSGSMFKILFTDKVEATTSIGGMDDTEIPLGEYYAGNMIVQAGKKDTDAVVINDIKLRMPFIEQGVFQRLVEKGIAKLAESA